MRERYSRFYALNRTTQLSPSPQLTHTDIPTGDPALIAISERGLLPACCTGTEGSWHNTTRLLAS